MLANEICKITGITKKALEYYSEQGLIAPDILENGYRDYSAHDAERLEKISVLRRLGVGTGEIRSILQDTTRASLQLEAVKKQLELERDKLKKAIIDDLGRGKSYSEVSARLKAVESSKTITEKLIDAFPGCYGRFICMHFARFLNEPIVTQGAQEAFDEVVEFLDNVPRLNLPEELESYFAEGTKHIGAEQMTEMLDSVKRSMESPDEFLRDNAEILEKYLAYKQSEEYKSSPACRAAELMRAFNSSSGYYDVLIPAIKRLSPSYAEYSLCVEEANKKVLAKYPQVEELNGTAQ